jgi:cyclopropane fatty-acyl-phospholipid synthase-like methyltransferase
LDEHRIVMKPCAESSEQNWRPIMETIKPLLQTCNAILEIGSGTGQHAVYFSEQLPHLTWQSSDLLENHEVINLWIDDSGLGNVLRPIELDTAKSTWPDRSYDAVFSANTVHIMNWRAVKAMFSGVGNCLEPGGMLLLYGPFNYAGEYTSDSNARFDQWLKERDPQSGIRDFEALNRLAAQACMILVEDFEMPVNNRLLYWKKL